MIIYKATNLINGKQYIGQTIQSLAKRKNSHCAAYNTDWSLLKTAIQKYGKDNFRWEVIDTAQNIEELNSKEIFWISKLNTMIPYGYNLDSGGKNKKLSEQTKKKISKAHQGKKLTKEQKDKISKANKGRFIGESNPMFGVKKELHPWFGKAHTEESKQKMSFSHRQNPQSFSQEMRKERSNRAKGVNNPKAKLNLEQVNEIKKLLKESKLQQKEIAKIFDINPSQISAINTGRTWN
jgi:group I intron endonuclease